MPGDELTREGQRILTLCNACRYCEGYCAVFPAMEQRTIFSEADLGYLANLCHNCGECYHACPYTPPHEYAINVPKTLAEIRVRSYRGRAWSSAFALGLAAGLSSIALFIPPHAAGAGFYDVIPHELMAAVFSIAALWVLVVLWGSLSAFTRLSIAPVRQALTQRYMDRGPRRVLHHLTFYGFLLCFASTCVAAFYHFALHWTAPYPYLSAPVVLGTLGGIALTIGTSGQFWMKWRQDPLLTDVTHTSEEKYFIALLWLTAVTGLALLVWRATPAMAALLVIHLAVVLGLFVTMPYGKFVHGIFRLAALVRNERESTPR